MAGGRSAQIGYRGVGTGRTLRPPSGAPSLEPRRYCTGSPRGRWRRVPGRRGERSTGSIILPLELLQPDFIRVDILRNEGHRCSRDTDRRIHQFNLENDISRLHDIISTSMFDRRNLLRRVGASTGTVGIASNVQAVSSGEDYPSGYSDASEVKEALSNCAGALIRGLAKKT